MADGKKLEIKGYLSIDHERYKQMSPEQRLETWTFLRDRADIALDLIPLPFYDERTLTHYMIFVGFKETNDGS